MLRAFISYAYRPEIEPFADAICSFLEPLQVEAVDGKWPNASIPLPEDIIGKIKNCEVLISLMFEGIPSPYSEQELGVAKGLGVDVIQITDGNVPRCGLIAEQFHISRSKGDFFVCTELAHTLNYIKQKRFASSNSGLSSNAPFEELESEAWPVEVLNLIFNLRTLFAESQFARIEADAKSACEKYPNCWRLPVAQSSALIHQNKFDEADKLLDSVIDRFAAEPRALSYAYDNKGWMLYCKKGNDATNVKKRLRLHGLALRSEKRVVAYFYYIICLLLLDRINNAEQEFANCLSRFPKAIGVFKEQATLQGKDFVQAIAKSNLLSALIYPRQED